LSPESNTIIDFFKSLQDDICQQIESIDTGFRFHEDKWERDGGGGGRTRIFKGAIIEKGGVNFSAVNGKMPEKISVALNLPENDFLATGVSIVLHPKNPFVPIIHMNVRYFETSVGKWWFGGGIDLTPHYVIVDDAKFFHRMLKDVCDQHNISYYPKFKTWADDYFFVRHRNETRGIGGIFFDQLNDENKSKLDLFEFVKAVGNQFMPIYSELINRNKDKSFDNNHVAWQRLRRGRYVEFNLVWDRGTKFGLDTNGRTESILMSLPPMASWAYDYQTIVDSQEDKTLSYLKKGIHWI